VEAERILIACQTTGQSKFVSEVITLFKSTKIFGGKLAQAQKIVYFTDNIDNDIKLELKQLGVKIRIIESIDHEDPHTNKIQPLKFANDEEDFDFLITLDTDMVIGRDFSEYLDEDKIGIPIEDDDRLSLKDWKELFEYFQISFPKERFYTYFTGIQTIPYFNSAVLLIPKKFLAKLYNDWKFLIFNLWNAYEEFSNISKYSDYKIPNHADYNNQYALSLAIQKAKLPYNVLPLEMNFSTHIGSHKDLKPERQKFVFKEKRSNLSEMKPYLASYREKVSKIKPFLIHHHHRYTDLDHIRYCYYDNINKIIDKINYNLNEEADLEIEVDKTYMNILRRSGDLEGIRHYVLMIKNRKISLDDVKKLHFKSDEYKKLQESGDLVE